MARRRTFVKGTKSDTVILDDDFDENMSSYLSYLKTKNRSPYTLAYYDQELSKFMHTLERQGYTTRLKRLTSDLITEGYIRYRLDVDDVKYTSILSTVRALKAFFNWAVTKGVMESNPIYDVPVGKAQPRTIETFTREQLRELFAQIDTTTFVGLRDYTMIVVLLETGVRVRELTDIKVNDVRLTDDQILIDGKNGEERLVPIQTQTKRILNNYMKERGESPVDWLFITHDDTKMNRNTVRKRTEKYGRMANIKNVRCTPHTFRHTFAKMSVKNGADIFSLQKVLGHKSLDMVRLYVNLFSDDVKEAHAKFSPIENLIRIQD